MKSSWFRLLLLLGVLLSFATQAAEPSRAWTHLWGTAEADEAHAVAVDREGNAYVTGWTKGELDGQPPVAAESVFLTKHAPDGTALWTRVWSATSYAPGRGVVVDRDGSVWLAGQAWGDLAGTPEVGNSDFFLMHVSPEGVFQTNYIWGSTSGDAGFSLAIDAQTNLYVAGFARGAFDGQPAPSSRQLSVSKLRPDGSRVWTRMRGSDQSDEGRDVVVDGEGNVYVCGFVYAGFDGQTFAGSRDICLLKYSSNGTWQWTRLWGGSGIDEGQALAADGQGNVYLAGLSGSFNGQTAVGDSDACLIKVNPDGSVAWTRLWGSIWADAAYDVAVAADGQVYVVGMASSATFDGLPGPGALFLTCFNANGEKQWTQRWGGSDGSANAVALTAAGGIWTAGTTLSGFDSHPAFGQEDLFLSRWSLGSSPMRLALLGNHWPLQLQLDATNGVDRVEVQINGQHLATLYGPPFQLELTPAAVGADPLLFLETQRIVATAYDTNSTELSRAEADWRSLYEGLPTSIVIESPWPGFILYTTNTVAPSNTLTLQARAHVWGPHPRRDELTWLPADNVEFSVDGGVVGRSTNGAPFDPSLHEVEFEAFGLSLGDHRVRARLVLPEGYRPASASRVFTVEQRQPELRLSRQVTQRTNYFEVTVEIENVGSSAATLRQLVETMTGFQACRFDSSGFGTSTVATNVTWQFAHDTRHGTLTWDLGGFSLPISHPMNRVTLTYCAVPVLFPTTVDYAFGGAGSIDYLDSTGTAQHDDFLETTPALGFGLSRCSLSEAVANAFRSSDYLLVTHPINLESAFGVAILNPILITMAELATVRGGVLGFHHGTGLFRSRFRHGDLLTAGDLFSRSQHARAELYVGDLDHDRIHAYSESGELTLEDAQMPLPIDLRPGDGLAMGNVRTDILSSTNFHHRPEIVVAYGSEHPTVDQGQISVFHFEYDPTLTNQFTRHTFASDFAGGGALAVGEAWDDPRFPGRDEIIYANPDGEFVVATGTGEPVARQACSYGPNDLFAAGNLFAADFAEIVIGDTDTDELVIYTPVAFEADARPIYGVFARVPVALEPDDRLAIGDVTGDAFADIIVADTSAARVTIYGYQPWGAGFVVQGDFTRDWDPGDEFIAGYVGSTDKERILLVHGDAERDRYPGAVELIHYTGEDLVGSSLSLSSEIQSGGRWADALATNWCAEGYLLLVGENEIVSASSRTWDLWPTGDHRVDYTDSRYAETDPPTRSDDLPELSVGRIVGNSADRILRALRNSLDLVRDPWRLDTSNAYCVSGPDETSDLRFLLTRDAIADILRDRGFATVSENRDPDEVTFRENARSEDIMFLSGHGSPFSWASPTVTWSNVLDHFDPELVRPVVYASSCLTGRYPESGWTLAEMFLWKGAAAYVGATEISYGAVTGGWNRNLAERFFRRLERGRPIGRSFTLAKRSLIDSDGAAWDPPWNRYHCDIYHFYGDPKLELEWPAPSPIRPFDHGDDSEPPVLEGPLSQLPIIVPNYVVNAVDNLDQIDIPGGEPLLVPGEPIVPFYTVRVLFPQGARVQNVHLEQRSGLVQQTGLILPPCEPLSDGLRNIRPAQSPEGWWPDADFRWFDRENEDGSTTLILQVFPFRYHAENREAEFYADYQFSIRYVESTVEITHLAADRSTCRVGDAVHFELGVKHNQPEPLDLVVHARVLTPNGKLVEALPARPLRTLKSKGSVQFEWTPKEYAAELEFHAEITGPQESLYDRARQTLHFERLAARIRTVSLTPTAFRVGDPVQLSGILDNIGSGPIDGTVILLLQDANGNLLAELRRDFSNLAASDSFAFDASWQATVSPRDCRVIAYAQYAGQTTALTIGAEWADAPLLWDTITLENGQLELTWPSVAGRRYRILFTPVLGAEPFVEITQTLEATPPRNLFRINSPTAAGFFLLEEH